MNSHRFVAPGTITNYEMLLLRQLDNPRATRWIVPWAALAERFHPISKEDWILHHERNTG